jgi:hypothetical protein
VNSSRFDYAFAFLQACHGIVIALSFSPSNHDTEDFPKYSEPSAAMKTLMIEDDHKEAIRHETTLGLAGRALLLRTSSARLMEIACAFFPPGQTNETQEPQAAIILLAGCCRGASAAGSNFPIFRGRHEFVHADYGREGSVWFNLKAREVAGVLSDGIVADEGYFRSTVLAVIAGILAPSLGVIALHAACVARDGRAILLAAPSGVGKSTISLALALRGWSLLSDDWTFISDARGGLSVWGMQSSIKLLPDARRYFPELSVLSPARSLNGELSFEVDPWSFFGVGRAVDATPVGIVLLQRAFESGGHICHASPSGEEETLRVLLEEIEEQPEAIAEQNSCRRWLMRRLCRIPSLKVRFKGEPAVVAADLDEILTEHLCA